jgi:uncharacterized repeat protein (TIGR03803 family)
MKKILLAVFLFMNVLSPAQTGIWGVTGAGGDFNAGAIFKTDASGNNYTMKQSLFRYDGDYPKSNLFQASDGKFYGMTSSCCVFDAYGIFFRYDPVTKEYNKLFDFNDTINGSIPEGGLIQGKDGKLYGMTEKGGLNNWGVIFQYDPTTLTYKKKFDFDDMVTGSGPQGNLLLTIDGKMYGMTNTGGVHDYGTVFQFDPATSAFTKKFDFDGSVNGGNPLGTLIQAKNGKFYGLTSAGGKDDAGVIFEYDPSTSTYTKKFEFNALTDGGFPYGSLMEASDGNLYGLTSSGGTNNFGVLFQYIPGSSALTVKFNFDETASGSLPQSSLIQASNGKLYGTTEYGSTYGEGVLFEYDIATSTFTKKFEFNDAEKVTGKYPIGTLAEGTDGMLYGMSYIGGSANVGVLFKYNPATAAYNKEFDFHGSANGNAPVSALTLASDKMLYGVTQLGGINNVGALYQYDPVFNSYKKKFDFDAKVSGSTPTGSLMQASDGKLYGTCSYGGSHDKGVLFQFDPVSNAFLVKLEFDGTNGSTPIGELLQASDGKIYGMTEEGGATESGVLFQFDPVTSSYVKKFEFNNTGSGKYPTGGLTQGDDGKLYGVTSAGGVNTTPDFMDGLGVLFQYDLLTATYSKKVDFDAKLIGSEPIGTLVKAKDGKFYGMTTSGGDTTNTYPHGCGTIFQFDPSSSLIAEKFKFSAAAGSVPNGSLLQASNGNLYGVTNSGGTYNMGTLFQFDPAAAVYTKKRDFKQPTGKFPNYSKLTEITWVNGIADNGTSQLNMDVYPNPAKEQITIAVDQQISDATLKLITLTGQVVMEKTKLSGNKFAFNIADLASGAYFVELTTKGSVSRMKLIKE